MQSRNHRTFRTDGKPHGLVHLRKSRRHLWIWSIPKTEESSTEILIAIFPEAEKRNLEKLREKDERRTERLPIGANTAIFSVVDGVLLKPLPYEEPGQLVQLWEAPGPGGRNSVSPGAFLDWREHSSVFENLSLRQHTDMNLTGE